MLSNGSVTADNFLALEVNIAGFDPITLLPGKFLIFEGRLYSSRGPMPRLPGLPPIVAVGQYVRVESSGGDHDAMSVLWSGRGRFEIHVPRDERYAGKLGGLCGDNDGNSYNDLRMLDG